MVITKLALALFGLLYLVPLGVSVLLYQYTGIGADWWSADRSSIGRLPPARDHPAALVRVFAAPTVRWRGILAVHCWIVLKPEGASTYTRYDYTAWGEPIRVNGFAPDGRWFGRHPELVFAADGETAAAMIPRMQAVIGSYTWRNRGDYRAWPGPNSNTFVAAVLDAVPEAAVVLPPTAIGKDYPYDGRWLRLTGSGTGIRLSLGGYAGLTLGWVDGIEVNILGGIAGIDLRRPALKLPGLGRLGVPSVPPPIVKLHTGETINHPYRFDTFGGTVRRPTERPEVHVLGDWPVTGSMPQMMQTSVLPTRRASARSADAPTCVG